MFIISTCAVCVLIDWFEVVGLYISKVEFWIRILVQNHVFVESVELKLGLDYSFYIDLDVTCCFCWV